MDFDLVIKNATIVTAAEVLPSGLSIGIKHGKISCIGLDLPIGSATQVIDAEGAYVTPGGVDSHVHLAQDNAPTGDGWLTGSRSALAGGNTTIIAFASQKRTDESLYPVLEEYHRRSRDQSYCDYGFHFILTKLTEKILRDELPVLVTKEGITSVKLYMTYPAMKLGDGDLLEVMMRTRELGMTTMVHAENSDMIDVITKRLISDSRTIPFYHATARPQIAESEATHRAISLATLTDTPILIVHMSSPAAINHARKAQKSLLPVHAETCPHYLYLLSSKIATGSNLNPDTFSHQNPSSEDDWEGAKHVCAPPLRHSAADLSSVWQSLNNGTITVISSDHAPSQYNSDRGKRKPLIEATTNGSIPAFKDIPNGLPGIETRLPLLFHAAEQGRISMPRFVALCCTNPAKMYGLDGMKGSIAPGYDADLVVWYPSGHGKGKRTIKNEILHHGIDYTPFEGLDVVNWPRFTVLRGVLKWNCDKESGEGHMKDGTHCTRDEGWGEGVVDERVRR